MKILKISLLLSLVIAFFSSCQKEYSLEEGNPNAGGTWQFEQNSVKYNGNIDSASIKNFGGTKVLTLVGKSLDGQQEFLMELFATDSFKIGSYTSSSSQSQFNYSTSAKTIFNQDFLGGSFTVNIVSLSNNSIVGTFSGQVVDSTGNITQITLGTFISAINLSNNGGTGGSTAAGTLGATAGACTPATLAGTYVQGKIFNDSNTVQIQVNVTTPGTYSIATTPNNGVTFSNAGTFAAIGLQNIILKGTGTPVDSGAQNFTVTFGTSTCTFSITFLPGVLPTLDYFPTTVSSTWAYGLEGGTTADSSLTTVLPNAYSFGSNQYVGFANDDIPPSGFPDTAYYRKASGDYFQYIDLANYFQFDNPVTGEFIFLKDNVAAGTSFQSQNFTGTVGGVPITGYVQVTITETGVAATVGSLNFPDVIKVTYSYFYSLTPGVPVASEEKWFAKGIGMVYYNDIFGDVFNIGRYTVF